MKNMSRLPRCPIAHYINAYRVDGFGIQNLSKNLPAKYLKQYYNKVLVSALKILEIIYPSAHSNYTILQ